MQAEIIKETELILRAQSGDREAFDKLVKGCAGQIYNLSYRLTGDSSAAEDLSQDALVSAYKNIAKFQLRCSFATWLYRITVNTWKNRVKYEKRRAFLKHSSLDKMIETEDGEITRGIADPSSDPVEDLEQNQKTETVQKILSELDEPTRILIVLRDFDGKSYEEIAEVLDCRLGTIKSRLARARETLRQKFLKQGVANEL